MAKSTKRVGVHGTDSETGRNGNTEGCVITKAQWEKAPAAVNAPAVAIIKKTFATGTFGYFAQVSITIDIDGVLVKMSGNVQVFVPHSKEAK